MLPTLEIMLPHLQSIPLTIPLPSLRAFRASRSPFSTAPCEQVAVGTRRDCPFFS
jgi:hypothetical protein